MKAEAEVKAQTAHSALVAVLRLASFAPMRGHNIVYHELQIPATLHYKVKRLQPPHRRHQLHDGELPAVRGTPPFQVLYNECQRKPGERILIEDRYNLIILEAQVVDEVADGGDIRAL